MHAHLSGYMSQHDVSIFQLYSESGVREVLQNHSLHLDNVVTRHDDLAGFEVRLLQQRLILLAHHVGLNLSPKIHRDHHDDQ